MYLRDKVRVDAVNYSELTIDVIILTIVSNFPFQKIIIRKYKQDRIRVEVIKKKLRHLQDREPAVDEGN